jgi:hypothetical protein
VARNPQPVDEVDDNSSESAEARLSFLPPIPMIMEDTEIDFKYSTRY